MAMKFLDFLLLAIVQLLMKFHLNILLNEIEGDNFLALTKQSCRFSTLNFCGKQQNFNILIISLVV